MSEVNNYRKIAKNMAVLGGAQVVQMSATLIRAKILAVLLGTTGAGINSLILTAIMMMQQISSCGIFQSGVREMSTIDNSANNIDKFRKAFIRLTWICTLIGSLVMLVASPILSNILFNNYKYSLEIALSSLALIAIGVQSGYNTILQATQNLQLIAKATISGVIAGLFVAIPCYYFLDYNGIVPAIIGGYTTLCLTFIYYEHSITFNRNIIVDWNEFKEYVKPILRLGFVLMSSMIVATLYNFMLNAFISNYGSVKDVGLYQAAASMINQGMVIITIILASDFFPRISKCQDNNQEMQRTVRQQLDLALYIITPIAAIIIAFAPQIISLLLSKEFYPAIMILRTMSLGLIFKIAWTIMSYIILAKGDKKVYFIYDALIGNGTVFLLSLIGFYLGGLDLLAIAYSAGATLMVLILSIVTKLRCSVWIETTGIIKLFIGTTSLVTLHILIIYLEYIQLAYMLCFIICLVSILYLERKTEIISKFLK